MPNVLASIGRSGAVGDFVKEARMLRKQESDMAMEQEKLGLMRNEDRRADIKLGMESSINEEALRAARFKQQRDQEAYDEANKIKPWSSVSDRFLSKGMSDAAMEYFKSNGMIDETGPEPGVKQKYVDSLFTKINMKNEKEYDPVLATKLSGAHLSAVQQKKNFLMQAMESPEAFKSFKQQFPEVKSPEDLAEAARMAQMEYEQAYDDFYKITEKDKIMRSEAAAKLEEEKRKNKEMTDIARMNADTNRINAGANVTRADASLEKTKNTTSKISDVDREELRNIRDDERTLNGLIKTNTLRAQYDEKAAEQIKLWQSGLADLEKQRQVILGGYKQPTATTIKEQPKSKAKTVMIDGKEYQDGDIVTKDGKQFKVKVK